VPLSAEPRVPWLPWSADAFARAAREGKPIVLSIVASWCEACREMDDTTWADDAIAAAVARGYVAIRVDSDRRPDINERYNLGGWPTTAFLDAEGALLGGGTFVGVDRMPGVLARVLDALARGVPPIRRDERRSPGAVETALQDVAIAERVMAAFDEDYGGFGLQPKFPHAAPVRLAMALFAETGGRRFRTIAERTLDAIANGGLHDRIDGGFFRYAASRDWEQPRHEKLLETNATLLGLFAEAHAAWDSDLSRDAAERTLEYLQARLADPDGGFYGSENAAPDYFRAVNREALPLPGVDRALYADANALAVSALLATSAAVHDEDLARGALRSLERVLLACYQPGGGVAHYFDRSVGIRGLLWDQIAMIHALLDAHDLTEGTPYLMMAEELGHYVLRTMWDDAAACVVDRAAGDDDIGLLRERRRPFVAGAEAARALSRLERASGEPSFRGRAAAILDALAGEAGGEGPLAAHYLLARREVSSR